MFSKSKTTNKTPRSKILPTLTRSDLGNLIPKRNGSIVPPLSSWIMKAAGWKNVGEIPNISQAVVLAIPHTSNMDGVYALPNLFALDIKISIMGKHTLFKVPVLKQFLSWMGIIPINREIKGSVLQASIDMFKEGKPLFLGLSPEGTREYRESWKTGFYYIAVGANVPILPVALDFNTKEVRFLEPVYPTGNIEEDLPKIYAQYAGVMPYRPERLSQPLQDVNKEFQSSNEP